MKHITDKDIFFDNERLNKICQEWASQVATLQAETARLTQACEKEFASVQELSAENEKLKKANSRRCEHCGSDRIYHGPPDCSGCGAPNCCQTCCQITRLEKERDALKVEYESRVIWMRDICDIIGYNNDDGQHSYPGPHDIAKRLVEERDSLRSQLTDRDKFICQKDEALTKLFVQFTPEHLDRVSQSTVGVECFKALSPTITSQYVKKEVAKKLADAALSVRNVLETFKDRKSSWQEVNYTALDKALSLYEQSTK